MAMLNATWLETFAVLCETGHFTRTAQRLGMTQPGVSQHVRKLEEQVGHPLISKQGKHFWPTPVGESVFALGLARRAEEERFRKSIEVDDPDSGEVKIACSGGFAMSLYPHLLPVMQAAPNLAIHVEAAPQKSIRAGILEGRFDLGVLASDPDHPRLTARLIGREELCVVLPIDAASARLDFEALDARGFIAHPDGFAYADALFSLNFPDEFEGADPNKVLSFSPPSTSKDYVAELVSMSEAALNWTRTFDDKINEAGFATERRTVLVVSCGKSDMWLTVVSQSMRRRATNRQTVTLVSVCV